MKDYKFSRFEKIKIWVFSIPMILKVTFRNIHRKKFEEAVFALKKILKSNDVCLDIGGAYGRFAYPMSRLVPQGRVISFEPGQHNFSILSTIKIIFRMGNVDILKKGLGKENKKAFLISPIKPTGHVGYSLSYLSDTAIPHSVCEAIEITTIDHFYQEAKLNRLDFVKCDTEGAEMMIFYGGVDTIKKYRPVILSEVENGHLQKFQNSAKEMESFFKNLNYKIFQLEKGDFLEKAGIEKDSNYFFIPEEKVKEIVPASK